MEKKKNFFNAPARCLGENVEVCHNLASDGNHRLVPVGDPVTLSENGGAPLAMYPHSDGTRSLLVVRGNSLWVLYKGTETKVADVPCTPSCAYSARAGFIVMIPDHHPMVINLDSSGSWVMEKDTSFAIPIISTVDIGAVTAQMPARQLRGVYNSRSSSLVAADIDTLTSDYLDAYYRICDLAAADGAYIMPVMVRWSVRDFSGRTVYTSGPVMMGHDSGIQATTVAMEAGGDGFSSLQSASLTAMAFRLNLRFPSAEVEDMWDGIGTVGIEVSPQIHPIDSSMKVTARWESFTSATGRLSLTAPGVVPGNFPAASGTMLNRRVVGTLDRFESVAKDIPVKLDDNEGVIYNPADSATRLQLRNFVKGLETEVVPVADVIEREISAPHSFSAAAVADSGDVVVWGNLRSVRFNGFRVRELAVRHKTFGAATLPTAVKITFHDGSSVVNSFTEHEFNSLRVSPLVTYPHPEAVEMTLIAGTRRLTLPLTPSGDRRYAYYLNPSLRPVDFDTEMEVYVEPAATPSGRDFPDGIAVARTNHPLLVRSARHIGSGDIVALTPAPPLYSVAWSGGYDWFYAFSPTGIYTLSSNGKAATSSLVDRRGVVDARHVAIVNKRVMAFAGGDLVAVQHRSAAETLCRDFRCDMMGCPFGSEDLWVYDSQAGIFRIYDRYGHPLYTRDGLDVTSLLSAPGALFLSLADGRIADAAKSARSRLSRHVKWRARYDTSRYGSLLRAEVSLFSSRFVGDVTVRADGGAGSSHALTAARYHVDGELNRPLSGLAVTPFREYTSLSIDGEASPDTVFESLRLTYEDYAGY